MHEYNAHARTKKIYCSQVLQQIFLHMNGDALSAAHRCLAKESNLRMHWQRTCCCTQVFRQKDQAFVQLLDDVRYGRNTRVRLCKHSPSKMSNMTDCTVKYNSTRQRHHISRIPASLLLHFYSKLRGKMIRACVHKRQHSLPVLTLPRVLPR
jgi:hypothetical protein